MANPNTIDLIVRQHLVPLLKPMGFVRKGRVFRRFADNGDAVVLDVQASTGSRTDHAVFFVNLALVMVPWLQKIRKSDDPADPRTEEGCPFSRVYYGPPGAAFPSEVWQSTPEIAQACGRAVAEAIAQALPWYLSVLGDRAGLLARIEAGEVIPNQGSDSGLRMMLLLDAERFGELRAEIDELRRYLPESPFADWLEARMAEAG